MYQADEKRYETMKYHRCGASGLMLPDSNVALTVMKINTGGYET